jgi:hypothetical protein
LILYANCNSLVHFFVRLKPSVEVYLDTFDPVFATTPHGVFCEQRQDYPAEVKKTLEFLAYLMHAAAIYENHSNKSLAS